MPICKWFQEDEGDTECVYNSECGHSFILNEGTPEENAFKYCTYCGAEISQVLYAEEKTENDHS